MAAMATGQLTGNGTTNIACPVGTSTSFPSTFAVVGGFSGATVAVNAGFYDNTRTLQFIPISGASLTAPGAVNLALRCDALQIAVTGAGAATMTYWLG